MKNSESDIPSERVDGDGATSVDDKDELTEGDQEINHPSGYNGEPAWERPLERQSWSNPGGYVVGVW
jgi:hypothetical protein